MYGVELEKDDAIKLFKNRPTFLKDYFKLLADNADFLSHIRGHNIDAMFEKIQRGPTQYETKQSIASMAGMVLVWLTMFRPYTQEQTAYFGAERMIDAVKQDAHAYRSWAIFVLTIPSKSIYFEIANLDPKTGYEYLCYCASYTYANIGTSPQHMNHIELEEYDDKQDSTSEEAEQPRPDASEDD